MQKKRLTLNTVDTINVNWMSPQTLTGICGGVTIRVANHTTTAIDTDVTNMKATIGICKTKKDCLNMM